MQGWPIELSERAWSKGFRSGIAPLRSLAQNVEPGDDPKTATLRPVRESTLLHVGSSTGDENANLYMRGVNEGHNGEILDASDLLDVLDVFGEDGLRMYLVGFLEGEEDAAEDEAASDPDAREVIVDYETGEVTPIERDDEDDPVEEPDRDEDSGPT